MKKFLGNQGKNLLNIVCKQGSIGSVCIIVNKVRSQEIYPNKPLRVLQRFKKSVKYLWQAGSKATEAHYTLKTLPVSSQKIIYR